MQLQVYMEIAPLHWTFQCASLALPIPSWLMAISIIVYLYMYVYPKGLWGRDPQDSGMGGLVGHGVVVGSTCTCI